ncbi:hypothetical protein [Paracoccus spongiarum]|uniref:Uncharacterized protein n=1 Tax=Paracoccus spongiarum TaxID=3064387 RepID=A0ABT9J7J0_9RHOB|nr:hypothetical protein [Paracoccus sp. 2205BS29-5]MDP5305770.1 hypothetical protein [Paracoccus sp. 2205BS29-5]
MLGDFFTYVASEASVIADAPLIFAMAVLASATVVWWLVNLRFGGIIDSQRERLQARDEKIAEYKTKLEGAEPDEARAHIKDLEARLARLEPRRLSEVQRKAMVEHLRSAPGAISIAVDGACFDGQVFSRSFTSALREAGWEVSLPMVLGLNNPPSSGLRVQVADLNNLTNANRALFAAMDAVGLSYEKSAGLQVDAHHPEDAELLITSAA